MPRIRRVALVVLATLAAACAGAEESSSVAGRYVVEPAEGGSFSRRSNSLDWVVVLASDGTFVEGNYDPREAQWHTSEERRGAGSWRVTSDGDLYLEYRRYWGVDVSKLPELAQQKGIDIAELGQPVSKYRRDDDASWVRHSGGLRMVRSE